MKKLISILLAVFVLSTVFAGCGGPPPVNGGQPIDKPTVNIPDDTPDEPIIKPDDISAPTTGNPVSDSFTAYNKAKTDMVSRLSDALISNEDTLFVSFKLLGVITIDLTLVPASLFGFGQEGVASGLSMFGGTNVQYTENGNNYTIKYTDAEGKVISVNGIFDAASNSLITTITEDGVEIVYSEYKKTSFGYIGQYYINSEGSGLIYQISVKGNDGFVGISEGVAKPAALTGGESVDFPSGCSEWYAISGSTVTGKTEDGTALSFEYIPE